MTGMKYYFIYKETDFRGEETGKVITHHFRAESLSQLLENFQDFLKGAGFVFDGTVDIVTDDIEMSSDEEDDHSKYYYDFDRNKSNDTQMSFDFEGAES
jgi:hypothetical protein